MDYEAKKALHMKLFDKEVRAPIGESLYGFQSNLEDRQMHYSLRDDVRVVRHYEESVGFNGKSNWIGGDCAGTDLSKFRFIDTQEALDVCVVYVWIEILMQSWQNLGFDFNEVLLLREDFNQFFESRYAEDRPTRENLCSKLGRFNTQDYMNDENYTQIVEAYAQGKQLLKDTEKSQMVQKFLIDQKLAKRAIRKDRLKAISNKFRGFKSKRYKKQVGAFKDALIETIEGRE